MVTASQSPKKLIGVDFTTIPKNVQGMPTVNDWINEARFQPLALLVETLVGRNEKRPVRGVFTCLMAEWTGLEPATPGVTGRYSNQLNYHSW